MNLQSFDPSKPSDIDPAELPPDTWASSEELGSA